MTPIVISGNQTWMLTKHLSNKPSLLSLDVYEFPNCVIGDATDGRALITVILVIGLSHCTCVW